MEPQRDRKGRRAPGAGAARRLLVTMAVLGVAGVLASCTAGSPTNPNSLVGELTTRTVDVTVTGPNAYSVDDAPALAEGGPAGFAVSYNGSSLVTGVDGTLAYDAGDGAGPSLALDVEVTLLGTSGRVTVTDPADGIDVTVNGIINGFAVDDLGNVSGSVTTGNTTVTFSTTSVPTTPGTDPALEALLDTETDFCADAQQRLAGLDPLEVPISGIINTREANRTAFASSKAVLDPLTTRTWTDSTDVTTAGGDHATISNHISCKTRAADHVATLGVTTAPVDAECSTLNQRAIDLALAQMTPAQQAAVTLPALGPDVVRTTGAEWTTPLAPTTELSGNTLRAHALLTRWNDPAFVIFPDTIRGVHYCTTWSPAYMYTHLLSTIPAV